MLVPRTQSIVGSDEKYMMACDWNDNINTDKWCVVHAH